MGRDTLKNREYQKTYREKHPETVRKRSSSYWYNNPERKLWHKAKQRSAERGLDFNIEVTDIIIPPVCPILGIELKPGIGRVSPSSPTIDRKDTTKGYIKGNIAVISFRANQVKSDLTLNQIAALASYVQS